MPHSIFAYSIIKIFSKEMTEVTLFQDHVARAFGVPEHVIKSRNEKTNGFEGCSNKECTSLIFYTKRYSKEGLCIDCELERFPKRFEGCTYCRYPQKKTPNCPQTTCLTCSTGVKKWLKEHIILPKETSADHTYFYNFIQSDLFHPWLKNVPFVNGSYSLGETWKGFYAGGDTWVLPNTKIVIKQTYETRDELFDAIIEECKKHGIFLKENIQYVR